jgi:chaperonin GroES
MKLRPLGDRLIVRALDDEESTASGVVLPDTARDKPQKGIVVSVGDGTLDPTGRRVPPDVAAGDEVLYSKYSGTEIKVDGEELLVLRETDVLAAAGEARGARPPAPREGADRPRGATDVPRLRSSVADGIARLRRLAE